MRRHITSQKGAAAVEFAIVLPLLVLLVFGIIEFSVYLFNKSVITNATREGARQGIVFRVDSDGNYTPLDDTEIKQVIFDYAQQHLIYFGVIKPDITNYTQINPTTRTRGQDLTVAVVDYPYENLYIPITSKMGATVTMRME